MFLSINMFALLIVLLCTARISTGLDLKNGYVLSLDSNNDQINVQWSLHSTENKNLQAVVPGGLFTDLKNNRIIGDIFYGTADVDTRIYAKRDWTYKASLEWPSDYPSKKITNIVFFGVDTISNVSVNNESVGSTNNMFTRYSFPVEMKAGVNEIEVKFTSPMTVAQTLDKLYPTAPDCVPDMYNGECHANQMRKMQASFSWDWGPAFPSMGLWKPVQLEMYNSAIIRDLVTDIKQDDLRWTVLITVHMESVPQKEFRGSRIIATIDLGTRGEVTVVRYLTGNANVIGLYQTEVELILSSAQVDVWWPNGLGEQPLYGLNVTYYDEEYPEETNSKNIQIAFRNIQFIETEICEAESETPEGVEQKAEDCKGRKFYFEVNGNAVFMKGSNWIPASILPELGYNKTVVDYLLRSAKNTHMNMLRVWGGGVYESDYFYQRCDELGILVWQDLMFACSMYPDYDDFLTSVSDEVEQTVRRLQHHTSIAIWAGNNENEAALRGNWYNTKDEFERYQEQYIHLYVRTVRPIVTDNDPTRHYLVSSPTNGIESEKENYIAENPYDPYYGDTHYYNYVGSIWSMATYPLTRFASEYGFQAYPSTFTLDTAGANTATKAASLMKHRQHSPVGDASMTLQIETYIKPSNNISTDELTREMIYYSQVVQAESMRVETEFYRQSRYDWWTMGALYWQLNDVWQTPSWSSIEFSGRWKMLHYSSARFFSPVLISPRLKADKTIEVYLINDLLTHVEGTVIIEEIKWNNRTSFEWKSYPAFANGSSVAKLSIEHTILDNNLTFYRYQIMDENYNRISPFNFIFPFDPKIVNDIENYGSGIEVRVLLANSEGGKNLFHITISSDQMYLFVFLEVDFPGHFSDNGFHLINSSETVNFETTEEIDAVQLKKEIHINSIPYGSTIEVN